ncbi:para-nitrobenzyl esterase [Cordyceps fumosorosea ARSEF 2679]|uniref:Carboxylic ester hydrolase n=1 Tax=Cordyceps fumosorosea (strain ARSEF 2679) TaxID=1081104 RepID=A0A167YG81_CORFA|nr:para-nitrobenzyl esterase [Cordyceps fumosorosea ARSEF 2679]OAA66286.1 para-nitrobenzyl esterase [Cordyceps fumosorosea ARSEF 2679]
MAESSSVVIQLRDGAISARRQGAIIRARGIPYARAARFQPPQPAPPWSGVLDCTQPASICPQLPSRLEALNGPIAAGRAMSEDCPHLSVCAPATPPADHPLPVIVFLHGGGYTSGGADLDVYSGADLAACGVVFVGVTYRLGILGYQPIEGVAPANLGLLDQMAALRWVRDNVASFGGDPRRVTLAGSSAGADSVYCLLAADGAEGLFRRAILQSTPLGVRHMDRAAMDAALERVARSAPDPASMPLEELLEVQKQLAITSRDFAALGMPFAPTPGHAPLAITPAEFDARVQRSLARIPLLVGYCRDEGVAFEGIFGALSPDARPTIPTTTSVADFIGRTWFKDDADRLWERARAAAAAAAGGAEPWFYELVLAPGESGLGAPHTLEMPLLLGGWDAWKDAPMLEGGDAERLVRTVGAEFRRLWVAFARGEEVGETRFTIDEHFKFGTS